MKYLAILLVCAFLLAGCSGFSGKTTVTFWHAMADPKVKTLDALITDFEKTHPGIKIESQYVGTYDILLQKLIASVGSGSPPDMAQVYENWTTRFKEAGVIVPVQDFIDADPAAKSEVADIFPVFVRNASYDGKMWAFPFNKSIYVYYYNTTIFKNQGLKPPDNIQEFLSVCKALTKKDKDGKVTRYGFGFRINIDVFAIFYYMNKGKFFNENETKATFNDEAGVETLQFITDLVNKEKTAYYTKDYLDNDFASGRVASFIATTPRLSEMQELLSFKLGAAPLPAWKTQVAPIAGTNLAVFAKKGRKTAEKQKACWEFIKFLSAPENTAKWAMGTSYLPVRRAALKTDAMKVYVNEDPRVLVGIKQLDRAATDPRVKCWQEARTFVGEAVEKALLNKMTPKQALDEAAKKVNNLLEKEK
jgi:multiple sugar transport system substrate-binding protein